MDIWEILSTLGYIADTPGAYSRGLLAGRPGERVSGDELIGGLGMEEGGMRSALGFGADMLLDPMNLVPGAGLGAAAAKIGGAARLAGLLPEMAAGVKGASILTPAALRKFYSGTREIPKLISKEEVLEAPLNSLDNIFPYLNEGDNHSTAALFLTEKPYHPKGSSGIYPKESVLDSQKTVIHPFGFALSELLQNTDDPHLVRALEELGTEAMVRHNNASDIGDLLETSSYTKNGLNIGSAGSPVLASMDHNLEPLRDARELLDQEFGGIYAEPWGADAPQLKLKMFLDSLIGGTEDRAGVLSDMAGLRELDKAHGLGPYDLLGNPSPTEAYLAWSDLRPSHGHLSRLGQRDPSIPELEKYGASFSVDTGNHYDAGPRQIRELINARSIAESLGGPDAVRLGTPQDVGRRTPSSNWLMASREPWRQEAALEVQPPSFPIRFPYIPDSFKFEEIFADPRFLGWPM